MRPILPLIVKGTKIISLLGSSKWLYYPGRSGEYNKYDSKYGEHNAEELGEQGLRLHALVQVAIEPTHHLLVLLLYILHLCYLSRNHF